MKASSLLIGLIILTLAAPLVAHAADAFSLDIAGVSYDEECLTYCLQGLVNRDTPRLFLDTATIFGPSDQIWLKYLADKKGFRFTPLANLRSAIRQFQPDLKGLVLYDPAEDATRYLALTMAAQRNLLPVTPAMLKYETPALRAGGHWTDDDMTEPSLWHPEGADPQQTPDGMKITHTHPTLGYGSIARVTEFDIARTPLLEITVANCTAHWALKVNEGTQVDTCLLPDGTATGTLRYDLRPLLKRPAGRLTIRIFTVGDKSSITVKRLRLLSADGQPVTPLSAGDAVDCFAGLKVVEDLRGRFPDDLAAYIVRQGK